jgi:lysophospholipid acyltransferase
VLLTLPDSWLVWSRVYFYAVIGTALSTAFFASPGKVWLKRKLEKRATRAGTNVGKSYSQESLNGQQPVLGLPPEGLDETVNEIRMEMEARQRKGLVRNDTM